MKVEKLTGKQLEAYNLADQRLNIWEGSVRSSKTVSSLLSWIRFVRNAPPGNLLMAGRTERVLKRNIIDPMIEMLGPDRCRLIAGSGELWLLNRRIYLAGANDERSQDKIRGLTLLGVYADELATMPESFWVMLTSRLSVDGARLYGTSNAEGPQHWLKRDVLDRAALWLGHDGSLLRSQDDDTLPLARFSFNLDDNPHLSAETVDFIKRSHSGLWFKRYVEGLWVVSEGSVYDMFDPDKHVVDIIPPIQRWLCAAADYGTGNPFHAVLIGLGVDGVLYVVSEWRYDSRRAHRQLTDVEYSERFRSWLDGVPIPATRRQDGSWMLGVRPEYVLVDPSAASFIRQLDRDGMRPALANNAVLNGIRDVASLLAAGKLKFSRDCTGLLGELPGYAWDDKAARMGEDKPLKVNDHGCDALRYGIYSTRGLWLSSIPLATPEPADTWSMAR